MRVRLSCGRLDVVASRDTPNSLIGNCEERLAMLTRLTLISILGALLTTVWCTACHAHQDRIVSIERDGALPVVPREYGPAYLHVKFADGSGGRQRISSVELVLGARKTRLPACITALFNTSRPEDIRASASWYHSEELLPYYLSVEFYDPGSVVDPEGSGIKLLFNLHNARLIELSKMRQSMDSRPFELAAKCSRFELSEIRDYPSRRRK